MDVIVHGQDGDIRLIEAEAGQTLLEALREGGEALLAPCGGIGTCGKCRVLVRDKAGTSYRLACRTNVAAGHGGPARRSGNLAGSRKRGDDRFGAGDTG